MEALQGTVGSLVDDSKVRTAEPARIDYRIGMAM